MNACVFVDKQVAYQTGGRGRMINFRCYTAEDFLNAGRSLRDRPVTPGGLRKQAQKLSCIMDANNEVIAGALPDGLCEPAECPGLAGSISSL